jgi:hypothetical protein
MLLFQLLEFAINVNKSIVPELFEFYQSFTWILRHVQICITMVSLWSYFSYLQPSTTTILLSELPWSVNGVISLAFYHLLLQY